MDGEIRDRAKELWEQHPTWGKRRMADELKAQYGQAPRWETLLRIKKQVAYQQPERAAEYYTRGGVGRNRINIYKGWRDAGFLPFEARELTYGHGAKSRSLTWAKTVFNSMPGKAARQSRLSWIENLRDRGWTRKQIEREAREYYRRDSQRTPWDFIRQEYKPRQKVDFKEYRAMARQRSQRRAGQLYRRGRR